MTGEPNIIKVVLLGNSGVGKSSILDRYVNEHFDKDSQLTLGISFLDKTFSYRGKAIKLQMWDTAGQEKYASLAKMYYRDANIAILVYDLTDKKSLDGLKSWHKELKDQGPKNMILAIAGNKSELVDNKSDTIENGKNYAKKHGAIFQTTSAQENKGIEELFNQILDEIVEHSLIDESTNLVKMSKLGDFQKETKGFFKRNCCI